jgi:hypothetical protein
MPLARSRQRPWSRDPGPMATAKSSSHDVYIGPDVVVKIIDADGHSRLDRDADRLRGLEELITGHYWWRHTR